MGAQTTPTPAGRSSPGQIRHIPWGTGAVITLFVTYLMVHVLTIQGYLLLTRRPPSVPFSFREQMILTSLINGILLVVIPLAFHGISGAVPEHLGLTWKRIGWQVRVGFVAFLIVALPVNAINFFSVRVWTPHEHPLEKMVRERGAAGAISLGGLAYLAFLTAVVLAPAAEELIFRGVIQNWLSRVVQRWTNQGVLTPPETTPAEELDFNDPTTAYVPPTPIPPERPIHQCAGDGHQPNPYEPPRPRLTDRRGWKHDPATRSGLATIMPVVLTSVLFAAAHAPQWPAPIAIFFLSLALARFIRGRGAWWRRSSSTRCSTASAPWCCSRCCSVGTCQPKRPPRPRLTWKFRRAAWVTPVSRHRLLFSSFRKSGIEMFFSVGADGRA